MNRRSFLKASLGASTLFFAPTLLRATPHHEMRLSLHHIHTGEWFKGVIAAGKEWDKSAVESLHHLLRDWRTGESVPFDRNLFTLLHQIAAPFGGHKKSFDIICGYRSQQTNAHLRGKSKGVAKKSLHMQGKAIDFSLSGTSLSQVRDAAKSLKKGGVGYYPKSGFVHVDIRPKVAFWS